VCWDLKVEQDNKVPSDGRDLLEYVEQLALKDHPVTLDIRACLLLHPFNVSHYVSYIGLNHQ